MKVFGFFRGDAYGVDLSVLALFPEPERVILVGESVKTYGRMYGYVYGFKGFIALFADMGELIVGPLFATDSGYFSDSVSALERIGVPIDPEKCKRFINEGMFEDFSPLKYTRVVGGMVNINFEAGNIRFDVVEKGINFRCVKPKNFTVIPRIYGKIWFLKLVFMGSAKRRRAFTLENLFHAHSS